MIKEERLKKIADNITVWYKENGRDLPWRRTNNPYYIWISEIMLQQTQVETVKPYYERFIHELPTVKSLANADLELVYKLWEGLGYYRRAAHLKEAAEMVIEQYGGVFPTSYEDIIRLKGIGMYTASAIASIAYGVPTGVVDGNTLRIIARVFNKEDNIALQKTKNEFGDVMDSMIIYANPSDFNQGMMDLGAMICTPTKPKCDDCPIASLCEAKRLDTAKRLPVNLKKVNKSVVEYMTVIVRDSANSKYLLVKNESGLLENLYGFVQYPCKTPSEFERIFEEQYGIKLRLNTYIKDIKHIFTHREWRMHVYLGNLDEADDKQLKLYLPEEVERLPVSTAHLKVLKAYLKTIDR